MTKTVSINKAAEILHVSRRTIYNHIQRGYLKTIRTISGQSQRVTVDSLAVVQAQAQVKGERLFLSDVTTTSQQDRKTRSEKSAPTT